MRTLARHALSSVATLAFVALAFGSSKPTPEEVKRRDEEAKSYRAKHDEWVRAVGVAYTKVKALDKASLRDKPCDGPAMLRTAKADPYVSLPTVHGPFLARFASADKSAWREDKGPWAFLTEATFRENFARHPDDRDAGSVDGTARLVVNDLAKNRFLIVFWPDDEASNRLPAMQDARNFKEGRFDGWLLVVDPIEATVVCQRRLAVTNSETIYRSLSLLHDPQVAIQTDFEDRIEEAMKAMLPENVKSSNNMGSLLK